MTTQCYKVYKNYKIYKSITRYTKRLSDHTLGPSMPQVALTPLGLPSLASNHKSTQGSNKRCLLKWDTQSLIDPHHNNNN